MIFITKKWIHIFEIPKFWGQFKNISTKSMPKCVVTQISLISIYSIVLIINIEIFSIFEKEWCTFDMEKDV